MTETNTRKTSTASGKHPSECPHCGRDLEHAGPGATVCADSDCARHDLPIRLDFPPRSYIVVDANLNDAVVAPPGYSLRYADGTVYRDGGPIAGPEHGPRDRAFRFKSHRAAARVASGLPYLRIVPVDLPPSIRTR